MKPDTIKVLLVEDNPGDARLLKEHLTDASMLGISKSTFEWVTTDRLTQAQKLIESERFDVVLLDLSLPDSHGLDTFDRLQSVAPNLPIIVLSGLDDSSVALEAVSKGAQDYLVKGEVNASLLLRSVYYAIERKRSEESALQKARDLDRLKKDFHAVMIDEIRTPLAGIRQNLSGCLDGSAGECTGKQGELLTEALAQIDRLQERMKAFLDA